MKKYALLIIVIFISSCSGLSKFQQDLVFFELEKTTCMGTCPAYILKIDTQGNVQIEGEKHLELVGKHFSRLNKEQLNTLRKMLENAKVFDMKDSYTSFMMDLPTKYVTVYEAGKKKKIKAYGNIPKELKEIIKYVDGFRRELKWKEVK